MKLRSGSYLLALGAQQIITISKVVPDSWRLDGDIGAHSIHETHKELQTAIEAAEYFVRTRTKFTGLVLKNAKWRSDPISERQLGRVEKECQKLREPIPVGVTRGLASNCINRITYGCI